MLLEHQKSELTSFFGADVLFNEPLASYVAYRVGGPADALVFPNNAEQLGWVSDWCEKNQLPLHFIGTGTNLLIADSGLRGVTLSFAKSFQEIQVVKKNTEGEVRVRCGGGVEKAALLRWAVEQSLTGLEFSAGVPGTIGGGIFMNAGTKYGCYGDIIEELEVYDRVNGYRRFSCDASQFGYRSQGALKGAFVLSATFRLAPGNREILQSEVERIIAERASKQPLNLPSCGSTFKNPPGQSAGRLIERAGLKGTRRGNAEISLKHANFILNLGNASAGDILDLIDIAKNRVCELFGVELECEVIILGDTSRENKISHQA